MIHRRAGGGIPLPTQVTEAEELLLKHLELIERAATRTCRHLGQAETEDFVSRIKVKLCDNDYAVIRRFKGKNGAKLSTYLVTVIHRDYLDYLDHLFGKWRPSAAARRQGPVAVELDRLLHRDGRTFDEACEILSRQGGEEVDPQWLAKIAAQLPDRSGRPVEDSEPVDRLRSRGRPPEQRLLDGERRARLDHCLQLLCQLQQRLPAEDRLILRMYGEGRKVSDIARRLHLEQKPLYRRLHKILQELRRGLEERGVQAQEVAELLLEGPPPEEEDDDAGQGGANSGAVSVQ